MISEGRWISVGMEFDLFKEKHKCMMDGAILEAVEDKGGFFMTVYLNNMTEFEIKAMRELEITTRMIREGNKVMFLIRFGVTPLIFEATFDPTLYGDLRAMQITFDNHMLNIVGVERTNNIIKSLRVANFPMKLKQALITAWTSAYEEKNYSDSYRNWVNDLYRNSVIDLWEKAENVGYFGERGMNE